jgi:hypothetical protein
MRGVDREPGMTAQATRQFSTQPPTARATGQTPHVSRRRPLRLIAPGRMLRPPRAGQASDGASQFASLQQRLVAVKAAARAGRERSLVIVPPRTELERLPRPGTSD